MTLLRISVFKEPLRKLLLWISSSWYAYIVFGNFRAASVTVVFAFPSKICYGYSVVSWGIAGRLSAITLYHLFEEQGERITCRRMTAVSTTCGVANNTVRLAINPS